MNERLLHEGRWLELRDIGFADAHGCAKRWEFVRRRGAAGASAVVALTAESPRRIALVRQFRPPLGACILELPAGLIEAGSDARATALRELAEETGCSGTAREAGPPVFNSPGLTDEAVQVVVVDVTATSANRPEADEALELVLAPWEGLAAYLRANEAAGTRIDAKLWCLALGLELGAARGGG